MSGFRFRDCCKSRISWGETLRTENIYVWTKTEIRKNAVILKKLLFCSSFRKLFRYLKNCNGLGTKEIPLRWKEKLFVSERMFLPLVLDFSFKVCFIYLSHNKIFISCSFRLPKVRCKNGDKWHGRLVKSVI